MQPILSLQNVFYTYGDGTEALSNIALTVNQHELFVLFGPARSGKSTMGLPPTLRNDFTPSFSLAKHSPTPFNWLASPFSKKTRSIQPGSPIHSMATPTAEWS